MPKFLDLAEKQISNFVGIKYTSGDLAQGSACLKENRFIFLGADSILCGALAQGFDSSIMTILNICPELAIEIYESVKKGDIFNAREKQKALSAVVERVLQDGDWVPAMKLEFNRIFHTNIGKVRIPLA